MLQLLVSIFLNLGNFIKGQQMLKRASIFVIALIGSGCATYVQPVGVSTVSRHQFYVVPPPQIYFPPPPKIYFPPPPPRPVVVVPNYRYYPYNYHRHHHY